MLREVKEDEDFSWENEKRYISSFEIIILGYKSQQQGRPQATIGQAVLQKMSLKNFLFWKLLWFWQIFSGNCCGFGRSFLEIVVVLADLLVIRSVNRILRMKTLFSRPSQIQTEFDTSDSILTQTIFAMCVCMHVCAFEQILGRMLECDVLTAMMVCCNGNLRNLRRMRESSSWG